MELQNAVIADRFSPNKRDDVKTWINHRYGRLWDMEDWTFKTQTTTINVPYNTNSVARGTIGEILSLVDSTTIPYNTETLATRPEDFSLLTNTQTGRPYGWTIVGDNIIFDRPMDIVRTFTVLSQKKFVELVGDTDTPLVPVEYHLTIVAGAASLGLRLENDPSWQGFEDDWAKGLEDMKATYLTNVRTYADSYPSWP